MKSILVIILFLYSYGVLAQQQTDAALPKVFAPGTISAEHIEFNASFIPDGKRVFFSKSTLNWGYITLFTSNWKNGRWSQPQPLPFTGIYRDADPCVSANGNRLYFMSDRPVDGNTFKDFNYAFFYVDLKNGFPASEPIKVNIPFEAGMQGIYPSIAASGNIYFHSRIDNDADIYVSRLVNDVYQSPEKLSFNEKQFNDFDAIVSKDESFIVFISSNRKGIGGNDLWISFKQHNNTWGDPINLGTNINSTGNESAPGLSADNKTLYFSGFRETLDRKQLLAEAANKDPLSILSSYKNGAMNIYEVGISEFIEKNNKQ